MPAHSHSLVPLKGSLCHLGPLLCPSLGWNTVFVQLLYLGIHCECAIPAMQLTPLGCFSSDSKSPAGCFPGFQHTAPLCGVAQVGGHTLPLKQPLWLSSGHPKSNFPNCQFLTDGPPPNAFSFSSCLPSSPWYGLGSGHGSS